MALTADKTKAQAVVADTGVLVPEGEIVPVGASPTLARPVVVKPVDADNSFGVGLVRDLSDYADALDTARVHSDRVLVERFVELGREVRCATLVVDDELVCLPLEEYAMHPDDKPIHDAADKLDRDRHGELWLTAKDTTRAWIVDPDDPVTSRVWEAARRCHTALGCRHCGLFDFRIDSEGEVWFLEAGLYCSFARTSVVAMMASAAGIDLPDLFAETIRQALCEQKRSR